MLHPRAMGLLCILWCLLVLPGAARAAETFAELTLTDGRQFWGKVLKETPEEITIEFRQGDIAVPMTFKAMQVATIERRDIVEPDPHEGGDALEDVDDLFTDDDDEPMDGDRRPGGYAVFPADGAFGAELTRGYFTYALREAKKSRAALVVFHMDSGGGAVRELELIQDLLEDHADADGVPVAFFVDREAFSAAALLCLAQEHFFVGPGARLGAAVAFSQNRTGAVQVDEKFNAAFAATWRALAERSGRDPRIIDAMIQQKKQLWANTDTEPWTLYSERPDALIRSGELNSESVVSLDDMRTVLALTEQSAVAIGAARPAASPEHVALELDVVDPLRAALDGQRVFDRYARAYRNNMGYAERAVRDARAAARSLQSAKTRTEFRSDLKEMLGNLNRVLRLYDQFDYVRNYIDRSYDVESMRDVVRSIRRHLGRD